MQTLEYAYSEVKFLEDIKEFQVQGLDYPTMTQILTGELSDQKLVIQKMPQMINNFHAEVSVRTFFIALLTFRAIMCAGEPEIDTISEPEIEVIDVN